MAPLTGTAGGKSFDGSRWLSASAGARYKG